MAWEKSRDKWLKDKIQPEEDKEDVFNWILSDPVWKKADKITWGDGGSHECKIYIRGISQFLPYWRGDVFDVSATGGRKVKKWIVEQLVKGYELLQQL